MFFPSGECYIYGFVYEDSCLRPAAKRAAVNGDSL